MIHTLFDDDMPMPERFDGALRCRLCPDTLPSSDNEWCGVAQGIVCEGCCRAIMMGEARLVEAISNRRGRPVTAEDMISACMGCPRLVRIVTESGTDDEGSVRLPLH